MRLLAQTRVDRLPVPAGRRTPIGLEAGRRAIGGTRPRRAGFGNEGSSPPVPRVLPARGVAAHEKPRSKTVNN